jgi:glycerophosphoryl diester phosphodiesterase
MLNLFFVALISFNFAYAVDFDWQGHRGARGLYPENTINGMKLATEFPITTLELDVVVSKDNQVVVSHEPWMSEEICLGAKNKDAQIYKRTYKEIQNFDCGSKIHPRFPQQKKIKEIKPLLSELLIQFKDTKYKFNIEIKSSTENEKKGLQPGFKEMSDLVVAEVAKVLPVERYTIQSFDWRVLKHIHKTYPRIALVALRETKYQAKDIIKELGFKPAAFSPDSKLLKASDISYFHSEKIKVIPWTVNTVEEMKKLIALGVDGIITDYPNLIIEVPALAYELVPECPKAFNRFEGKCIRVPKHAKPSDNNPGWVCNRSYLQKRNSCIKIKLPKNAEFLENGKTWTCREGYERYRYSCRKK